MVILLALRPYDLTGFNGKLLAIFLNLSPLLLLKTESVHPPTTVSNWVGFR